MMNLQRQILSTILCFVLLIISNNIQSSLAFTKVASATSSSRSRHKVTTDEESQCRQYSDSSLDLVPNPFAVSTALLQNQHTPTFIETSRTTAATTTTTSRSTRTSSSYSTDFDVQRPMFSYSEHRSTTTTTTDNVLTPAVEKINQVLDDVKSRASGLTQKASSLGVSFGLSYSMLSNINGGVTLAVAWYMTCQRTNVSPVYQWKALLKSYGTLYAFLQAIKPIRIAAAISMARYSQKWLDATQERFGCGRGTAIAAQYAAGYGLQAVIATIGVGVASALSGVPVFSSAGSPL